MKILQFVPALHRGLSRLEGVTLRALFWRLGLNIMAL